MSQHPHRTLWRRDFDVVPAAERRLARFALQWLDSFPAARVALRDDDTLESMWRLTLPLLDPEAVAGWLPPVDEGSPDEDADIRGGANLLNVLKSSAAASGRATRIRRWITASRIGPKAS
ncbi:hypothetical protein [Thiocapsa sp.]|uniref:hypothetical protein n=1 Tax=Thiocapsa sp. TaxID=2024551 RepID=UPI00262FB144|nr:hypothetical protein [Thiocapsa sp.]